MEQIIGQLIEARHKAKLSLKDIHERTKIPLRQLEYLEAYEFSKIGPDVYIKGFVRRYAQEVGIDPNTLWEQEITQITPPSRTSRRKKKTSSFSFAPLLRIVTLAALAVVVAFLIRSAVLSWMEPAPPAPPNMPPVEDPVPDPDEEEPIDEPEPEPEPELELVESESNGAQYILHNAENLDIVVEYSGDCWTRIIGDGERLFERTYRGGQEEELSGAETFILVFGAPRHASVTVNGIEVDLPNVLSRFELEITLAQQDDETE